MDRLSSHRATKEVVNKHNFKFSKSLGQNFLIDDCVIEKIIESSNIEKEDLIIEIGPGLGVLTERLLKKSNNVVVIELDKKMIEILQNRFCLNRNLEIINDDVLKVDLQKLIKNKKEQTNINKVKIVANLPYYISTPIIMKLLENRLEISEIIVMVQKEVAQRLGTETGKREAGAITYAVEYYAQATPIIDVPKESFIPSPKVESQVIKLEVRQNPKIEVEDEKLLFNIIQKSFMQRRKTLSNALINNKILDSKEKVEKMFKTLEIPSNVRGENLTLEEFGKIANYVYKR